MNERIRELAEQAGLLPKEIGPVVETRHMKNKQHDLEKFAELIVSQMLDITNAHAEVFQTDRDRALIEHIKQSVKTHFGVEE